MNLERRVGRHLLARDLKAFLSPGPGFGEALSRELHLLLEDRRTPGDDRPVVKLLRDGLILDRVRYRTLLELSIRLTTAQDISLIIAEGAVHNRGGLEKLLREIDWGFFLRSGDTVALRTDSRGSTLYHEGIIRDCVAAVLDELGVALAGHPDRAADHHVGVRITRNICRTEISLAGAPLWQRGYRESLESVAPLREDLAQAALRLAIGIDSPSISDPSGSDRTVAASPLALFVPFAGSGTFLFEYLIALFRLPPFVFGRSYAFEAFPAGVPPSVPWVKRKLLGELRSRLSTGSPVVARLVDRDPAAPHAALENWRRFSSLLSRSFERAELLETSELPVELETAAEDVFAHPWPAQLPADAGRVFVPLNPPYGLRVASRSTDELYRRIGSQIGELAAVYPEGRLAGLILCPSESSWRAFLKSARGASATTSHFSQGGLDIRLCLFRSR